MSEPQPTPDEDEMLVAYLDGQLPVDECERIESRLATDESTRLRVRELDRVWDALDSLPRTTASASFTQTTVDMAALRSDAAVTPSRWRRVPWTRLAVGICCLAVGAMLAFVVSGAGDRRAVRNLPTALHASALENTGSIEFLTGLVEIGRLAPETRLAEQAHADAREWVALESADIAERRAWLVALAPEQSDRVAERIEAFRTASAARRETLLRLDRRIAAHPQSDELRTAALAYDTLVATLSRGERAQLRDMEVEKRLIETRRRMKKWAIRAVLQLSEAERDDLLAAIDGLKEDDRFARALELAPEGFSARRLFWMTTRLVALRRPPRSGGGPPREEGPPPRRGPQLLSDAWPGWASKLEANLPDEVRDQLAKAKDDRVRAGWWNDLLRGLRPGELSDAFAALPNDRIEQILLLPREELTEALDTPPDPRRRWGRPGGLRLGPPPAGPPPGGPRRPR